MSLTTTPSTHCEHCGSALAGDQRYCLTCGARAAAGPVEAPTARGGAAAPPGSPPPPVAAALPPGRDWTPAWTAASVAALALVLVIGVLIGRSGSGGGSGQAAAPIVRVGGAGTGAAAAGTSANTSASGKASESWPSGKNAWTVELGALSKDGTSSAQVAAAKQSAVTKGAKGAGIIDSDNHGSLPGGSWIVYSGVYGSKAAATKALARLKKSFPKAVVIHVTDAKGGGGATSASSGGSGGGGKVASGAAAKKALQDLNQSGDAYEKQLKKKPKTIVIPGKAPPKDNKAPGGGGGGETIG